MSLLAASSSLKTTVAASLRPSASPIACLPRAQHLRFPLHLPIALHRRTMASSKPAPAVNGAVNGSATPSSKGPITPSSAIKPEIEKGLDCWSVFSPMSGYMPKDSLNLGQGFMKYVLRAERQESVLT